MALRPLNEALQKLANEQLNEDKHQIETSLQSFKIWISEQTHLKSRTDDQFLIAFLRNSKHNLAQAEHKLEKYYAYIEKNPELFRRPDLKEDKFRKLLKCGVVIYLPRPITEVGPRVLLVRNSAYDPKEYTFAEISQFRQLLQDILLLDDDVAVVSGLIYIMDFDAVSVAQYFQASPTAIKLISQYMEEAVPLDLKANHFINTASSFTTLYNLTKSLMPAKTQNKMHVHGSNYEQLYKFIPKDILPYEYGGKSGNLQELIDQWEHKVLSYVEYFKDNNKFGVAESLRLGNSNTPNRSKFLGIF